MAHNPVVELDFDLIKDDIKEFLRGQAEFKDFDFEGAGLNILLDVLAKNSHLNAYMANMLGSEMFLDSAEIRQSVVSKAKEVGYTPRSVRASQAQVTVLLKNVQDEVPDGGGSPEPPSSVTMDAGTQFQISYIPQVNPVTIRLKKFRSMMAGGTPLNMWSMMVRPIGNLSYLISMLICPP